MLVDSHCHLDCLDLSLFEGDLAVALAAAKKNDVNHILSVCTTLDGFPLITKIADSYPDISISLGVHPTEVVPHEPSVEELVKLGQHPKLVAIGETGLDYYHDSTDATLQQARFRRHIQAAKQLQKPLIVHTRQARADTLKILKEEGADQYGGVMHCFTEDWEMAQHAMDLNFYISFSGIVTFKNAVELKEIAKKVPLDRMLVETDAPYLAPVPYRGKQNQPAYVRHVAEYIATLRDLPYETIARKTTENYFRLFGL